MRRFILTAAAMTVAAAAPQSSFAKPKPGEESNALVDALSACRTVAEAGARLACYDKASSQLTEAVERKEVVVLDRSEIRQTRKSLFGFSLPRVSLFKGESGEELEEIEATIASGGSIGLGKWQIRLEDGATWQTTEAFAGLRPPKAGQKVSIKKGALGNYFLRINGQRGLRGKRIG